MSDQKLPNTENRDIMNKAIAHDIVTLAFAQFSVNEETPEEYAKKIAKTYSEVLQIVGGKVE